MVKLGERIKTLRGKAGLTQIELAERVKCDQRSISRIELDDVPNPSSHVLVGIARELGTSVEAMCDGVVMPKKRKRRPAKRRLRRAA